MYVGFNKSHHLSFTHLTHLFRTILVCRQTVRGVHGTYKVKKPCCKGSTWARLYYFFWVGGVLRDCLLTAPGTGVAVKTNGVNNVFCGHDVSNCVGENTAMFKKLLVSQLVKIFTPLYGTRSFITDYTTARNVTCPHSEPDQSGPLSQKMCTTYHSVTLCDIT